MTASHAGARAIRRGPWYHGWNIVISCMIIQAATLGTGVYSFTLWVQPMVDDLSATRASVLMSITILSLGMAVLSPFAGRALDRYPARLLVGCGIASVACGLFLMSLITQIWQLWLIEATLMSGGMSFAGVVAGQVLTLRWFDRRKGLALGLAALGSSIGGIIFPSLCAQLIAQFGWRATSAGLGVAVAALIPLTFVFRKPAPNENDAAQTDAVPAAGQTAAGRTWTSRAILSNANFWILALSLVPLTFSFAAIQFSLGAIGLDKGVPAQSIGIILSAISVGMVVGKIGFGALLDVVSARATYWIAAAIMTAATLSFIIVTGFTGLAVATMLVGLAMGSCSPLMGALVVKYFGRDAAGAVVGLVAPILYVGSMAPPIAGLVRDHTGSYVALYYALALFTLVFAVPMLFIGKAGNK